MGTDLSRSCQAVESRKVLWIVALVLGSVLVVQYFQLPYGDRVLSLLPLGKAYFNSSDANGESKHSSLVNNSEEGSLSKENPDINHTEGEDSLVRSVGFVPEKASNAPPFSPSPAPNEANAASHSVSNGNSDYVSPSPSVVIDNTPSKTSHESGGVAATPAYISPPTAPHEASDEEHNSLTLNSPAVSPGHSTTTLGPVASSPKASPPSQSVSSLAPTEQHKSPNSPALPSVPSISDMNAMLLQSRASSFSESPLWPSSADQELLDARFQIEHADIITNHPALHSPLFRNLTTFIRSYELMERSLKVYVYNEGNRPVFHNPRLKGIYASEGWFMKQLEANSQFVTTNPEEAHLFYLPFSSQLLVDYVYVKDSRSFDDINSFLKNYVETIKIRHPFWNRTDGADHFLVACHDWAPYETKRLMANCIRALCNSDIKEGFKFGNDVSLPETNIQSPQNPMRLTGGAPASNRTILAFFAGKMHGEVRPLLLKQWENKDPDIKISGPIRKAYAWHMQNSKYCVCAKGYEVNSPRVVEAILYGCVPVIISDNFVPPFLEALDWEGFAVFVPERDIPELKNILVSIPERRYGVMQNRVEEVRKHFVWHKEPERFDIFHMILHSIWYNKVFRMLPRH